MTTISEAEAYFKLNEPRGEYMLVIKGRTHEEIAKEIAARWDSVDITEHIKMYMSDGMDKKEAVKRVAVDRGVPKREIYEFSKNI